MIKLTFPRSISLAYAGLLATTALTGFVSAADEEAVVRLKAAPTGVVRVSNTSSEAVVRGQSPQPTVQTVNGEYCPQQNCPQYSDVYYDDSYSFHDCPGKAALDGWMMGQCASYRMRQQWAARNFQANLAADCREKSAWARCKFGYFIPTGSCGKGTPPFGHYSMVYPVNPQHFDGRDGQVYAAQGYGGAVAMPMAPVVNHTYNYGWGVPSSRLTPVSHPVSPAQVEAYRANQLAAQPQLQPQPQPQPQPE